VTRSNEALVEPRILEWARTSAGLSLDEAAGSLQTKPENVAAWEGGETHPSMAQLRRMATTYEALFENREGIIRNHRRTAVCP
jgi:DNA-binding transcriptional regulator YiaG